MKKQLLSSFFIAMLLMVGVCSCDDIAEEFPTETEQLALECGINPKEYKEFSARYSNETYNVMVFYGLKNERLWVAYVDLKTKKIINEYQSNEVILKERDFNLEGAKATKAQFEEIYFSTLFTSKNAFFIRLITVYRKRERNRFLDFSHTVNIFNHKGNTTAKSKEEVGFNHITECMTWYEDSFYINKLCYTLDGQYLFTCPGELPNEDIIPISQKRGLYMDADKIKFNCHDYATNSKVWSLEKPNTTQKYSIHVEYELLDYVGNIYTFKVKVKDHRSNVDELLLKINVDTGKFVE